MLPARSPTETTAAAMLNVFLISEAHLYVIARTSVDHTITEFPQEYQGSDTPFVAPKPTLGELKSFEVKGGQAWLAPGSPSAAGRLHTLINALSRLAEPVMRAYLAAKSCGGG